jgi:ribonuclease D
VFPLDVAVAGAAVRVTVTATNEPAVQTAWLEGNVLVPARGGARLLLGFDTETRPAFSKGEEHPVSLIQLYARHARAVLVAHVGAYRAPPADGGDGLGALRALLESPNVVLAGMAVGPDIRGLADALGLGSRPGALKARARDLKEASTAASCAVRGGLAGLASALLGAEKWKSKSLQLSRWDRFPLSRKQETYAALDALWGGELAEELERRLAAKAACGGGGGGGRGGGGGDSGGGGGAAIM